METKTEAKEIYDVWLCYDSSDDSMCAVEVPSCRANKDDYIEIVKDSKTRLVVACNRFFNPDTDERDGLQSLVGTIIPGIRILTQSWECDF